MISLISVVKEKNNCVCFLSKYYIVGIKKHVNLTHVYIECRYTFYQFNSAFISKYSVSSIVTATRACRQ